MNTKRTRAITTCVLMLVTAQSMHAAGRIVAMRAAAVHASSPLTRLVVVRPIMHYCAPRPVQPIRHQSNYAKLMKAIRAADEAVIDAQKAVAKIHAEARGPASVNTRELQNAQYALMKAQEDYSCLVADLNHYENWKRREEESFRAGLKSQ